MGALATDAATAAPRLTDGERARIAAYERQERALTRRIDAAQQAAQRAQAAYLRANAAAERTNALYEQHLVALYTSGDAAAIDTLMAARNFRQAVDGALLVNQLGEYQLELAGEVDTAQVAEYRALQARDAALGTMSVAATAVATVRAQADAIREGAAERERARRAAASSVPSASAGGGVAVPALASVGMAAVPTSGVTPQSIDMYLAAKGSPMAGQGFAFMLSGLKWGIDPRLLVAIAGAESAFGEITCAPYNGWGWGCPNDPYDFASWAEAIDTIAKGLREYYLDEGRTTVALIQQKYAPSGAANDPTNLNSHWVTNVSKFLVEQGGNPNAVGLPATSASTGGGPPQ